jgi:hypothetical protein
LKNIHSQKKFFWIKVALALLLPINIYAQSDYYYIGSTAQIGVKLNDNGRITNAKLCQVKLKNGTTDYSPYQVKEYGFKDGRVFIARDIKISDTTERVFLERLAKGNASLYFYKAGGIKTFFFEKDSSLFIEIPRSKKTINFKKQLSDLTSDCSNIKDAGALISYNKNSLAEYVKRYNNCELKPFPHLRYGAFLGYELEKLVSFSDNISENINYFDLKYDGGFLAGLFIDIPLFLSNFSVHSELIYSKHGYSYNKLVSHRNLDFVANLSSLKLPVLLRYSFPSNRIRPYLNAGGILNFNTRNESSIYEAVLTGSIVEINDIQVTSLVNDHQIGYTAGGGIEFKLYRRNSVFTELRYSKLYGTGYDLKISAINLITGIIF